MINILERQFDRLAKKIRERSSTLLKGLGAYFKRLLFPLYLFPIKLITYTAYYLVKFLIKFIFAFIGLIFETIIFPFKSLKNFLKSNVVLPRFLKVKDMAVIQVYRRDSKRRNKKGFFTGVSSMIQFADFFTGVILSLADKSRKTTKKAEKHKNIYRKTLLSKCPNLQKKLEFKENYYWPNFQYQKMNVFYWKPKQKASRGKSPSRS